MLDRILEIRDRVIDRIKNVGLVQGLEIGSGVAVILGAVLINFLSSDDLIASDIVEHYDNVIEVEDAVIENATDISEQDDTE